MEQRNKEAKEIILYLRTKIPSFKCIDGCTACCGPQIIHPEEERMIGFRYPFVIRRPQRIQSITCQYALRFFGCQVYEERPIVCRLFGTIKNANMQCPYRRRPGKFLTKKEELKIMRRYIHMFDDDMHLPMQWYFDLSNSMNNMRCNCEGE